LNNPALFKTKVVVVVVIRTMPLESNVAIIRVHRARVCICFYSFFVRERTAQFVGESNALVTKNNRERRTE
jgi:hypothetical protein